MYRRPKSQRGFTLVEMIVVIVITGIVGGMVAIFIRSPMQGYVASARRAEITDIADTALRRLGRDLRTAVPNSVRVPSAAGSTYLEFLPTKNGGRYRVNATGGGALCGVAGDDLDFGSADTCFEVVGAPIALVRGASDDLSDQIIIGSTQSSGDLPYRNTAAGVRRPYAGTTGTRTEIFIAGPQFPNSARELEGYRFEVVPNDQQAVTYACLNTGVDGNGDGTGTLTRYWAYGYKSSQAAPATLGGSSAMLADRVSACNFVYDTSSTSNSLVAVSLTITRSGESVNLYHEIHVNNIP